MYIPRQVLLVSLRLCTFKNSKMLSNTFFCIWWIFLIFFGSTSSQWLHGVRQSRQDTGERNLTEEKNQNDTNFNLVEKNQTRTTDNLYWTAPDEDVTAQSAIFVEKNESAVNGQESILLNNFEENSEFSENGTVSLETKQTTDVKSVEENKTYESTTSITDFSTIEMDEKIVLPRNNCDLEIVVDDMHDTNVQIKFEPLKNKSNGKCYITLNGHENSMLGVLISDIKLYQNGSDKEVLKVIITHGNMDFVIKEYNSKSEYQPLLLTESHRVYIVLYYIITTTTTTEDYSHFNIEVFSYHKNENYVDRNEKQDNTWTDSGHLPIKNKLDNIFFTTEKNRYHIPYFK